MFYNTRSCYPFLIGRMLIRKLFKFENAHIVRNCTSDRCKRSIHGHSYKVELLLKANRLDHGQMVYDFGLLKGSLRNSLIALIMQFVSGKTTTQSIFRHVKHLVRAGFRYLFHHRLNNFLEFSFFSAAGSSFDHYPKWGRRCRGLLCNCP